MCPPFLLHPPTHLPTHSPSRPLPAEGQDPRGGSAAAQAHGLPRRVGAGRHHVVARGVLDQQGHVPGGGGCTPRRTVQRCQVRARDGGQERGGGGGGGGGGRIKEDMRRRAAEWSMHSNTKLSLRKSRPPHTFTFSHALAAQSRTLRQSRRARTSNEGCRVEPRAVPRSITRPCPVGTTTTSWSPY